MSHLDRSTQVLESDNSTNTKWYGKASVWLRIAIIIILLVMITLAIIYNQLSSALFLSFLEWMEDNIYIGSCAFITIYIICTVMMVPGSILTLGAGFVYCDILGTVQGVLIATIIVWVSASIGATISFMNGRYLLRSVVVKYISNKYPTFKVIELIVKEYGFSVTFWLRLSSITPYNVFNYFMGITSVRLMDYILAHTGMIPDVAVYAFVGGSISTIIEIADTGIGDNIVFMIVLGSTLIISICGMITISCYAKKKFVKLRKEIREKEEIKESELVDQDVNGTEEVALSMSKIKSLSTDVDQAEMDKYHE